MTDSQELVSLLYDAIFGRAPDPEGMASWSQLIDQGLEAKELVSMLLQSDEAIRTAQSRTSFRSMDEQCRWWNGPFAELTTDLLVTDVGAAPLLYEDDIYSASYVSHHQG